MDKAVMQGYVRVVLLLLSCFALTNVVNGQNSAAVSEFISIDCGFAEGGNYPEDEIGGLLYQPDKDFLESGTGISATIEQGYIHNYTALIGKPLWTLRSFPNGSRNCYNLSSAQAKGKRVLVRASFLYGNYDGKNEIPSFELHLGVELWDRVKLKGPLNVVRKEILHVPSSNLLHVCLVNTGEGTPFISALELRPMNEAAYATNASAGKNESLLLYRRNNYGGQSLIRYPDDIRDRVWYPYPAPQNGTVITLSPIPPSPGQGIPKNVFEVPSNVMETAISNKETGGKVLTFSWDPEDSTTNYYVYMHFAEVMRLPQNQTRVFNILMNNKKWYEEPVSPSYWNTTTIFMTRPAFQSKWEIQFVKTESSTLPPLINAVEIYTVKRFLKSQTRENDVQAMVNMKASYRLKRDNWVGDPCLPEAYVWEGLHCSYNDNDPPIITHLNLSASGLAGNISLSISNLISLEYLDLSNNGLTGQVPNFLSQLSSLKVLNLTGNHFSGPIPQELIERTKNGLILRIEGYEATCGPNNCDDDKTTSKKFVVPMVALVIITFILLTALLLLCWRQKRKRNQVRMGAKSDRKDGFNVESKNKSFTYSEILNITKNFKRVLGEGGFGTVYHGCLGDDIQVAIKVLSQSSVQGYHEFQTEVELLTRVHHRNLTSLVGYCYEGTNTALVYEFMANGNLRDMLSERTSHVLSWIERLQIAMDAAQGLDYLHNGCKPPIIHRDVKTTNILLNEKLQAKIADFGLSRTFAVEEKSYVSTKVVGTPGYLDPEYFESRRLTEKSDVFSFGIVILELISGRPTVIMNDKKPHIIQWVNFFVETGDIRKIIDPKLKGEFEVDCVWKALELAMACASPTSNRRPNMDYVVTKLKECLSAEKARKDEGNDDQVFYSEQVLELMPIAPDNSIIGPR
ncbi:PREDICTED: putative leucine-rich repeat receptor-like protein kinase At2g19210 isoform X2 [Ipomoea nil]|uniref:putative leucine-rich repeat receptor-like protein kinase At2g19210 isoform X2 n=1 Tax=Ipomoea nil TaxID=35883 RepID=UPI000900FF3F|nr:PREDICTED: putative leucine-rich repeat receptor-like protein kinase At2g19210 isoform X2 [Ipomoea nil]